MKIASVDGYVLNFPQDPPWGYSKGWVTSAPTLLIELSTNDGISGWGEAYLNVGPNYSIGGVGGNFVMNSKSSLASLVG